MLFCGIDLHSNNSFVVISDEADKVLYSRRLPNNLPEICAALSPCRQEMFGIVVESTYNWYWLVDGLQLPNSVCHRTEVHVIGNDSDVIASDSAGSPKTTWLKQLHGYREMPIWGSQN